MSNRDFPYPPNVPFFACLGQTIAGMMIKRATQHSPVFNGFLYILHVTCIYNLSTIIVIHLTTIEEFEYT